MIVGFTNGVMDLFHSGHRHFLTECKKQCDYLIVAVNSDASVKRLKGGERPKRGLVNRMGAALTIADAVIPFEGNEGPLILGIQPDIVFKGYDHCDESSFYRTMGWHGPTAPSEVKAPKLIRISHLPGFSTTGILSES